jgi:hypothetical protein
MTIGHVLEIVYYADEEDRRIYIALDINDIAKLKKACERAEAKAVALKEQLRQLPSQIIVVGERADE